LELASLEIGRLVRFPGLGVAEGESTVVSRARFLLRFVFVSGGAEVLERGRSVLDSGCSGRASGAPGRSSP
jgi:hypothetical protein